jgi:hypothetical protein
LGLEKDLATYTGAVLGFEFCWRPQLN